MMIVKDPVASYKMADRIAIKLMKILSDEMLESVLLDDYIENIYVAVHIIGNLTARVCHALDGYKDTYGIPEMTLDVIHPWIEKLSCEYLSMPKK